MINCISRITLYVNDQEEAKKFWTEKLDFAVKLEQPMGPGMKWLEVGPKECGTVFVLYEKKMMQQQNPEVNTGHPSIILTTQNIEKAHEEMLHRGVNAGEILNLPYGKMFHFSDMDGNRFMLREEAI